jgi:6-phosphogluconolactonase/glucosamine-6-phosphate isomerase/deaminase
MKKIPNTNITYRTAKDGAALAKLASSALSEHIIRAKNQSALFLSSGGSSIPLLDMLPDEALGPHLTFGMLDDRFTPDPKRNNLAQIMTLDFYKRAKAKGTKFISTIPKSGDTLASAGERLNRQLHAWRRKHPDGFIVVTQGVGPDGHTTGILPYPEDPQLFQKLFFSRKWAMGYNVGNKSPEHERLTVTATFLIKIVDYTVTFMSGQAKQEAVEKIVSPTGELAAAPCRILREVHENDLFYDGKIVI